MESSAACPDTRAAVRETVAPLWCEALAVESASDEDDFFALGGHSLAALHMIGAVEDVYGLELNGTRDIWDHPTLGAFVTMVAGLVANHRPSGPDGPAGPDGRAPATPAAGTGA
ncbi:acyl carrier protein [Streptomyces zingiberis]|uniref:Acyl carrier protein n=1 Tax=Streptomyces zingiberis TaxID=2053010 RepID=A0ABX1C2T7_9ACTN|nr:phosphopantetheine-binding protein [Streptomyces zingiberis]NJQ03743.1 acyl carrier protein [Streptomyces zingiberis]